MLGQHFWRRIGAAANLLIFPAKCLLCENYHESALVWLCAACTDKLRADCRPQSRTLHLLSGKTVTVFAAWHYDERLETVVHALKYEKHFRLGRWLGSAVAGIAAAHAALDENSLLIPVPLHRRRLTERGFNQSHLIARGVQEMTGMPVHTDLLRREYYTKSQATLTRDERLRNVAGAFACPGAAAHCLAGATVTLIDDVTTTGATLRECAKALYLAGTSRVLAVTVAYA